MPLAFLNLGPSEIAILVVLFLLLFGVDKAPDIARSLGRARAQLDQVKSQASEALRTDDQRALDAQLSFESERERRVAEVDGERRRTLAAAATLGIETEGRTDAEIRAAIRQRLDAAEAGGSEPQNKAADARQ
ncbi:MAG TPA: twin-arginine translocase TatA/TatE family subunit [Candidatus Thermoplasmatota archaeon]|nr:twin-arginine translocase TatA/TatE family subunit [Candidatus Thermoplasmatota archaeon]